MTSSDVTPEQEEQPKSPASKAAEDVQQAVSRVRQDLQQTAAHIGEEARRVATTVEQSVEHGVEAAREKTRDSVQHVGEQVSDEAQRVAGSVQQGVGKARETITQVGTDATHNVAEARKAMRESAYTVKESAADSLLSAAENIRREALKGGNDDVIRNAHTLSRSMEKAALYLDSRTFDQISDDATGVVREKVWESMGIVFVLGLLIGLLMNSGSRD